MTSENYIIVCPNCGAEECFEAEKRLVVMIRCLNCRRQIILDHKKGILYTVSARYFKNIMGNFKTERCGKIIAVKKNSSESNIGHPIQEDKIEDLKDLLSQDMDVNDFLGSIDDMN